MRECLVNLIAK